MKKRFKILAVMLMWVAACGKNSMNMGDKPETTMIPSVLYNALYVVNGGDNTISVIDVDKNEVTATINFKHASYPHHINSNSDKSLLAIAAPGMDLSGGHSGGGHGTMTAQGALLVIDAKTGETKASRMLDAMNHNGIFSSDGKEIWTSQMMQPGSVLVLDAQTLEIKKTIMVGDLPAEITFSADGQYAFVANSMSNNVMVIDANTKNVVKTIAVDENPVGAWLGNNDTMYVDCEMGKTLQAIDAKNLQVLRSYQLGFVPGMAATAPNSELWVTDSHNGRVIFYMANMDMKTGELATGAGAHAIAFSDDGKTAYISNQTAGTVSVIEVNSHKLVKTIMVGRKPNGMFFRGQ